MTIKPHKFDFTRLAVILVLLIVGYMAMMWITGCATLDSLARFTFGGKTITGGEITYIESPFGWGAAALFFLGKLWFWRKKHIATKALDRVICSVERFDTQTQQYNECVKLMKGDIAKEGEHRVLIDVYDAKESLIRSRIKKLFHKHRKIK